MLCVVLCCAVLCCTVSLCCDVVCCALPCAVLCMVGSLGIWLLKAETCFGAALSLRVALSSITFLGSLPLVLLWTVATADCHILSCVAAALSALRFVTSPGHLDARPCQGLYALLVALLVHSWPRVSAVPFSAAPQCGAGKMASHDLVL